MSYSIKSKINPDKDIVLAKIKHRGKTTNNYLTVQEADYNVDARREKNKELMLGKDEEFVPVLSKRGFSRLYINGATGSGKSTLVKDLLTDVEYPILMFSRLQEDPSIDDHVDVKRINCETLLEEPFDLEELEDHIVCFDDHATFADDRINKAVQKLCDQALESARHYGVPSVITTSHIMLNHNKSKQNLVEANCVVAFHHAGSVYHFRNWLKTHCGLSKGQIDRVLNMKGRYVMVFRNNPPCAMSPKELIMF